MAKRRTGSPQRPGRKVGNVPPAQGEFRREVARRLRVARSEKGLSRPQLARRLSEIRGYEITSENIRKYEGGPKPSQVPYDIVYPLCELLDLTPGMLLAPLPFARPARAA